MVRMALEEPWTLWTNSQRLGTSARMVTDMVALVDLCRQTLRVVDLVG